MDVLAHGLWGGAVFGRRPRGQWKWAFLLGVAPDVIAFGPMLLANVVTGNIESWARPGPPPLSAFPPYVFDTYNVTHSLVVWSVVTGILWLSRQRFPWILGAWSLHILCDIPAHTTHFFPTPYLWPFHTPFYDGTGWARPGFMLANYTAIALAYGSIALFRRRQLSFGKNYRDS